MLECKSLTKRVKGQVKYVTAMIQATEKGRPNESNQGNTILRLTSSCDYLYVN